MILSEENRSYNWQKKERKKEKKKKERKKERKRKEKRKGKRKEKRKGEKKKGGHELGFYQFAYSLSLCIYCYKNHVT